MNNSLPPSNKSSSLKLCDIKHLAADIIYMEANFNYTFLHLSNGSHILMSYTLKKMEQEVAEMYVFERVHRSYLINTTYINTRGRLEIGLKNGVTIPVARRRRLSKKNFEILHQNLNT